MRRFVLCATIVVVSVVLAVGPAQGEGKRGPQQKKAGAAAGGNQAGGQAMRFQGGGGGRPLQPNWPRPCWPTLTKTVTRH